MFYFKKAPFLSQKRWKVVIPALVMAFLCLSLFLYFAVYPYILKNGSEEIKKRISSLSEKLDLVITLKEMKLSLSDDLVLEGLAVYDHTKKREMLHIGKASFSFSIFDLLRGTKVPERIRIEDFILKTEYGNGKFTTLSWIREKLRKMEGKAEGKEEWRFPRIEFDSGEIAIFEGDEESVIFSANRIKGELILGGDEKSVGFTGYLKDNAECPFSAFFSYNQTVSSANWDWDSQCPFNPVEVFKLDIPPTSFRKLSGKFDSKGSILQFSLSNVVVKPDGIDIFEPLSKKGVRVGTINAGEISASIAFSEAKVRKDIGKENIEKLLIKRGEWEFSLLSRANEKKFRVKDLEFDLSKEKSGFGIETGGFVISRAGIEGVFSFKGMVDGDFTPVKGRFSTDGRLFAVALHHFIKNILVFDDSAYRFHVDFSEGNQGTDFRGILEFKNAGIFYTKLCLVPLEGLNGEAEFSGKFNLTDRTLKLNLDKVRLKEALFSAGISAVAGGKKPLVNILFTVPEQPCQTLIEAVPPVMIPRLEGIKLDGTLSLTLNLHLNFMDLQKTNVEIEGNFDRCKALSLGRMINVEKLNRKFVHSIYIDEKAERIKVGPATDDFVPIKEIPEPVWQAALATEDMGFFRHKGFKLGLIKRAIRLDLEKGWFVYGGSTISQQLVKNLFLSREKTLSRKLEEAIITWEMERSVEKERILELYLNCIEFGAKVFGIKKASKVYFNKHPSELNPLEGAFIMAAKPDPKYAYNIYRKRLFSEWWIERMRFILERLWKEMKVINEETYLSYAPYIPKFYYPEDELPRGTEEPLQEQSELLEDF